MRPHFLSRSPTAQCDRRIGSRRGSHPNTASRRQWLYRQVPIRRAMELHRLSDDAGPGPLVYQQQVGIGQRASVVGQSEQRASCLSGLIAIRLPPRETQFVNIVT